MNKERRLLIWNKYGKRCAYCGNDLEYKNMQADHLVPQRSGGTSNTDNLMPSCRRCNHYKRGDTIETFRCSMQTLHERVRNIYIVKVAIDYGIVSMTTTFDGFFYFEKDKTNDTQN